MVEYLNIEGHTIAYSEHNPGAGNTPIVYLHGILNTIHLQETVLEEILEGQHWFALSLPGHYPATFNENFQTQDLTPEFIGDSLAEAIRQIGGGQPVRLIGHSTGGFASYTIARTAPELVESMLIVDGFARGVWYSLALRPGQMIARLPLISMPVFRVYMALTRGHRIIINLFMLFIAHNYVVVRERPDYSDSVTLITSESKHLKSRNLYHYFHNMPVTDIGDWLEDIQIPVTIIHGDNDPVILPEHGQEMHDLLPDSRLIWLENCGHDPFNEARETLTEEIHAWLAG